jgi:sugar/nucleoside kinase (ribokinase family)
MSEILSAGEMLVEVMRAEKGVPHTVVGGCYKGPFPSGAPCIFIDAAARMLKGRPLRAGCIGVVGDDDFGEVLLERLGSAGVNTAHVRVDPEQPTGVAFVQYNLDGSRSFVFVAGAAGRLGEADIRPGFFEEVVVFHVTGSALTISDTSRKAVMKGIELTLANGGTIAFDPNLRVEMMPLEDIKEICRPVIAKSTFLLPNENEALMLTGEADVRNACLELLELGPRIVVLKQGPKGCTVYSRGEGTLEAPGFPVEEVDPTGAGDTFDAAFIVEYLGEGSLLQAAGFANAAAALKVTSFGPMASHSRKEVEAFLASTRQQRRKR